VNLVQIRLAVPKIFHTQTKKSHSAKTEPSAIHLCAVLLMMILSGTHGLSIHGAGDEIEWGVGYYFDVVICKQLLPGIRYFAADRYTFQH